MRLTRRAVLIPAVLGVLAAIAAVYVLVSLFITQSLTSAERNPQEAHPSDYGLSVEDVEFTPRGESLLLRGWHLPAENVGPHVIFVHGLNNVRSGDNVVELAGRLVERGYSVLLFDLRGHGSSDDGRLSGGYYERRDVWGAYDYLLESHGAEAGAVGLVGFSMGAATALLSAAEEPGIRAVVADSPYAVASELLAQETARSTPFPQWLTPAFIPAVKLLADWRYGIDIDALAPERAVARLGYPALVIHGDGDTRIPVSHGARVAEAGPPGTELWRVPGVKHVEAFEASPAEYVERVAQYLGARLERSPTSQRAR